MIKFIFLILSLFFEEMTFHKYSKLSDKLKLILYAFLENFGYKQLHTIWRLQGLFDLFLKKKSWGDQKRQKF